MTSERSPFLADVLKERSSVRSFSAEPVNPDLVRQAIEAAGWAPSPHGTQPWKFAEVLAEARRRALAETMSDTWRQQLRLDGDDESVISRRLALSRQRLEVPPVVVVLCLDLSRAHTYPDVARQEAEYLMAVQSLGAAAQNFLLAIHATGLDAGWMCAPLFCADAVREELGLAAHLEPHAMFPVGKMAKPPKRRPRMPVEDLIEIWLD